MNIIGVELHTPKRSDLEGLAVLTTVYVVAAIAVVSSGLIEWPMVFSQSRPLQPLARNAANATPNTFFGRKLNNSRRASWDQP